MADLGESTQGVFNAGSGAGVTEAAKSTQKAIAKITTDLEKAARYLKQMREDSLKIQKNLAGAGFKGSGGGGGPLVGTGGFSTPLLDRAMGRSGNSSNGMPTPSFSSQMASAFASQQLSGAGSSGGKAPGGVAQFATAAIGAGLAMLPGTAAGVGRQQALFQTALYSGGINAGNYNAMAKQASSLVGPYMTSVGSDVRSMAAVAGMGFGPNTQTGKNIMGQLGAISLSTGMQQEDIAATLGSQMTNPVMANRMMMLGINTISGGTGGGAMTPDQIASKIVKQVYGGNVKPDQIRMGLQPGGALTYMLNDYVPDPSMQGLVVDAMYKMAQNNGKTIRNDVSMMKQLGVADSTNNPRTAGMRYTGTENALSERFRNQQTQGYTGALDSAANLNEAFISLTEAIGPLIDMLVTAQSYIGTGGQTRAGGAITGFLSSLPGVGPAFGAVAGMFGLATGGPVSGPGGPKSDVIPALLSNGEYVINASSVNRYGKGLFDSLNAQKLNHGGEVTGKNVAAYASQFAGKVPYSGPSWAGDLTDNTRPEGVGPANPDDQKTWANGWGCSEFTKAIFGHFGINIGDSYSEDQRRNGTPVDKANVQPGDLIVYHMGSLGRDAGVADHVAIYTGNGMQVEAAGDNEGTISSSVSWSNILDIRRFVETLGESSTLGSQETVSDSVGGSNKLKASAAPMAYSGVNLSSGISGIQVGKSSILDILGISSAPSLGDSGTKLSDTGASSSTSTKYSGGSGGVSFAKWLYSQGLSGKDLENMWAIGMRESNGKNIGPGEPGFNGSDYGIFQINKTHEGLVKSMGYDSMKDLMDPVKNLAVAKHMSNNWKNLSAWGVSSGGGMDYSAYGGSRDAAMSRYDWWGENEKNTSMWFGQAKSALHEAGIPGYSKGAWRIDKDQTARIHQGEMIIPAGVAEQVRGAMRGSLAGQGSGSGANVTINVSVANGSDQEAMRLARRVKDFLDRDSVLETMSGVGA
jgi:cell wall-associated NlpC family hydrolase